MTIEGLPGEVSVTLDLDLAPSAELEDVAQGDYVSTSNRPPTGPPDPEMMASNRPPKLTYGSCCAYYTTYPYHPTQTYPYATRE